MTQKDLVEYLRNQAYWINYLAEELEKGNKPDVAWCIDLPLPKVEEEVKA